MKQKTNTKFNILWIAVIILLVFATITHVGATGSWLSKDQEVVFNVTVQGIDMRVEQTLNKGGVSESTVEILNGGTISLSTNIIEADTEYPINVDIINNESGLGYYVRYRARAVVNGVTYNINNLIQTDFYVNNSDGWAYHTADSSSAVPTPMAANSTRNMLISMTIPATANSGLSIGTLHGKHFKLFVEIESNGIGFDV